MRSVLDEPARRDEGKAGMVDKIRFAMLAAFSMIAVAAVIFLLLNGGKETNFTSPSSSGTSIEQTATPTELEPARQILQAPVTTIPVLAQPVSSAPDIPDGASFAGIVVDPAGNLLTDMYVAYSGFLRVDADDKGQFLIEHLDAGEYELIPQSRRSEAHADGRAGTKVTVVKDQQISGIRLVHDRESESMISGRVTDGSGNPLGDVEIIAEGEPDHTTARYETGPDGLYTLEVGDGVGYLVTARHSEYGSQQRTEVAAGDRNVDFALQPRGYIEGRVVDVQTGLPVSPFKAGAMLSNGADDSGHMTLQEFANPEGTFRLKSVEPGDVYLYVLGEGYTTGRVEVNGVRPESVTSGVVVRLSHGAAVEGRVVDTAGNPVAGAKLRLEGQADQWLMTKYRKQYDDCDGVSDEQGAFSLEMLDTGFDGITALHAEHPDTTADLHLVAGQTTRVTIVMTGRATVEGTVRINGEPAANQSISIRCAPSGKNFYLESNGSGSYRVERVPDGEVSVTAYVSRPGYRTQEVQETTTRAGQTTTVDFDFRAGTASIGGKLIWQGKQPTEWLILARSIKADIVPDFQVEGTVLADGTYVISGLIPGTYEVGVMEATNSGSQDRRRSVEVVIGEGEMLALDIDMDLESAREP